MKALLSVFCFSILLSLGSLSAQTMKFGHINFEQLLQVMPEREAAQKDLEKLQGELQKELAAIQKEIETKSKEYIAQQQTLTAAIRATKEDELNSLNQRLQTFHQQAQQNVQQEEANKLQPILEKARKAIADVGKEQGLLFVFEVNSGLLYHSDQSIDILSLVKTKLGIK